MQHISIMHQTPNYISVQTPCGNLIQFTTNRENGIMSFQGCWCIGRHVLNTLCIHIDSHVQNSCIQAPFCLFTFHLHHLSLRRCVCLSWPVHFLSSLPSLLSTVSINHQLLPGLRLILTIWRFYYWKIDQKSAKNIVLRRYFLSIISLPLSLLCSWWYTLGDISLAIRLLLANSSNTVSPPQSSLAQIYSVFSRHFQNYKKQQQQGRFGF